MRVFLSMIAVGVAVTLNACGAEPAASPTPGDEDCEIAGDEDGNGLADCDDPACGSAISCQPGCGNGRPDAGEACDDGNAIDGDGCDHDCTATACGNGIVTAGETCDDANSVGWDGCDHCTTRVPGPLVAPGDFRVESAAPTWGHCFVAWTALPGDVDGYEVWRSWGTGPVVVRYQSELVPDDVAHMELDLSEHSDELLPVKLKIRSVRGTEYSAFSPIVSFIVPLNPPRGLFAEVRSDGVVVHWNATHSIASTVEVERSQLDAMGNPGAWSLLVSRPLGSWIDDQHVDTAVEQGKAYAYRVTLAKGSDRSASPQTTTLILGPPLSMATIQLPKAPAAAADGNGHYAFSTNRPEGFPVAKLRFTFRNGASWVARETPAYAAYAPFLKLDASGRPHAVYTRQVSSQNLLLIIHGWAEGGQWLEETIAERFLYWDSSISPLMFDLDATGTPVVAWIFRPFVGANDLEQCQFEVATKTAGTWTMTPLVSVLPSLEHSQQYHLFTDRTGVPHLIVREWTIRHLQPHNGAWTSEVLPLAPEQILSYDPPAGVGNDENHLVVCFAQRSLGVRAVCIRKGLAGWGSLEPLGSLPNSAGRHSPVPVLSADGSRLAVIFTNSYSSTNLFRSDLGGPWTVSVIDPLQDSHLTFDAGGKLRVFSSQGESASEQILLGDYRLETEP